MPSSRSTCVQVLRRWLHTALPLAKEGLSISNEASACRFQMARTSAGMPRLAACAAAWARTFGG